MKRLANLYLAELQPSRERLTLNLLAAVCGGLILLLVVLALSGNYLVAQQEAQARQASRQMNELQQQLENRTQQLAVALKDPALENKISRLEQQVAQQQRLLQQMLQLISLTESSFASLMRDVARVDNEELWLQRIIIDNGQLTLQGRTLEAGALPSWLASFAAYDTLRGRQFAVFELRDEAAGALEFTVGSAGYREAPAAGGQP
ncbi:PilN domain-containing protein [Pseudidiomarina sp.]|uniref:PilN domain-containing protein n=1 Tax=Pseudidiomarina sp. TaxID=2081707 RepID=UPI00299E97FF|nr:PilN domain-containing protein [Pseudidiomarina sp.]MDX1706312.1 PilN domain-containing protein [Pseudidiomarina sp.]